MAASEPLTELPRRLYKYRPLRGDGGRFTWDILRQRRLWFAVPSTLNDEEDCRIPFAVDRDATAWKPILLRKYGPKFLGPEFEDWDPRSEPPPKVRELLSLLDRTTWFEQDPSRSMQFRDVMNRSVTELAQRATSLIDECVGILSLSDTPAEPRLWEEYADAHRGICLEFDPSAAAFPRLCQVRYSNEKPEPEEVTFVVGLHQHNAQRPGLLAEYAYQAARRVLPRNAVWYWTGRWIYSKSESWRHEQEWRSVAPESCYFALPPGSLRGVIFGCEASQADVIAVASALKGWREPIPLFRATLAAGTGEVELCPIGRPRSGAWRWGLIVLVVLGLAAIVACWWLRRG